MSPPTKESDEVKPWTSPLATLFPARCLVAFFFLFSFDDSKEVKPWVRSRAECVLAGFFEEIFSSSSDESAQLMLMIGLLLATGKVGRVAGCFWLSLFVLS